MFDEDTIYTINEMCHQFEKTSLWRLHHEVLINMLQSYNSLSIHCYSLSIHCYLNPELNPERSIDGKSVLAMFIASVTLQ